jgi:hypothetical protein
VSEEAERPELEAVRRLLAEARHGEPMPDDVAARMDRVLRNLSADREVAAGDAPVIDLAAHRRRRAATLLVAAAVIVVGGVTAAQHLPRDSGTPSTAAGAGSQDRSGSGADTASPQLGSAHSPLQPSPGNGDTAKLYQVRIRAGRVLVRPRHFTVDALSGRQAIGSAPSALVQRRELRRVPAGCIPTLGGVDVVPATYEKAPAALVYHAPAGTTQVVDLYVCGTSKPVRSVTLPTP